MTNKTCKKKKYQHVKLIYKQITSDFTLLETLGCHYRLGPCFISSLEMNYVHFVAMINSSIQ
jgi:hypothetical protein